MKSLIFLVTLFLFASICVARNDATDFDLQGFIDKRLAAGEKKIVVPPGRYRVTPRHAIHLTLSRLTDVDIVCTGVEMVCTQTTRAVTISDCHNLKLTGLTIDYDPLPFTQGPIVAMAPDKSWLEFELSAGYPDHQLEQRIEIFDKATRLLKVETRGDWQPFQSRGGRRYRVSRGAKHQFDATRDLEEVGDILVTNQTDAAGGSAGHAVVAERCAGLVLQDVTVYASNCFAFLEESCDGSTYLRCKLDRRPPADDLDRPDPRVRSADADAFHFSNDLKGPTLLACVARFQGDDAVNIHGQYLLVTECDGDTLRVLNADKLTAGEPLEVMTYQGLRLPDAAVVSVNAAGKINDTEKAFLLKQHMDEGFRKHWTPNAYKVVVDRPIKVTVGAVICSTRRTGNGFIIRGCVFEHNRSRGILIKASDGLIENNVLTGNWMEAVEVTPEFWWLESGSSNQVTIKNNLIRANRGIAVGVYASGGAGGVAPAGAHHDISVIGNKFVDCPWPNVVVTSTDGLVVRGNSFSPAVSPSVSTWKLRDLGLEETPIESAMFSRCENVVR